MTCNRAMRILGFVGLAAMAHLVFVAGITDEVDAPLYKGSIQNGINAVWILVIVPAVFGFLIAQRDE